MGDAPRPLAQHFVSISPAGAQPLIVTQSLSRAFGHRRAVSEIDLTLEAGQCLALFGPNGAGKTTLLRILAGLLKPTAGRAAIAGVALPAGPTARALIGLISHHGMLYDALTARENVEFSARLHGMDEPRRAAEDALQRMQVHDRADVPIRSLSRGMQQRVAIARAMVHTPRVVLLDEPFTGLDELGARALSEVLAGLRASGAAMVLVTHNLGEGLALATHAAIMRDGRFVRFDARDAVDHVRYPDEYRDLVSLGA